MELLFFFSFLFKITCERPVSKGCKKHVSILIMLSLVTKITGVEDALSISPFLVNDDNIIGGVCRSEERRVGKEC